MSKAKPIDGMTTTPYGLPLMGGAWVAFIVFMASQPEAIAAFESETGHSFSALKSRGLDRMIDEATGRDKACLVAWADWVTKHHWGEEPETALALGIELKEAASA